MLQVMRRKALHLLAVRRMQLQSLTTKSTVSEASTHDYQRTSPCEAQPAVCCKYPGENYKIVPIILVNTSSMNFTRHIRSSNGQITASEAANSAIHQQTKFHDVFGHNLTVSKWKIREDVQSAVRLLLPL